MLLKIGPDAYSAEKMDGSTIELTKNRTGEVYTLTWAWGGKFIECNCKDFTYRCRDKADNVLQQCKHGDAIQGLLRGSTKD